MGKSIKLFRIMGIPFGLHPSWFLIFIFLTYSLANGYFANEAIALPYWGVWALGLLTSVLFFGSVLAHELGHSIVAIRNNIRVKSISLFFLGGVAEIEREPDEPGQEFRIAIAGPMVSLVLALAFNSLAGALSGLPYLASAAEYLGRVNLLLGLFNLIPGFPMDGGRILRAAIWKLSGDGYQATRVASFTGRLVAFGFLGYGMFSVFSGNLVNGMWMGFIGLFLLNAAGSAFAQARFQRTLDGIMVDQVMSRDYPQVPGETTLDQVVNQTLSSNSLDSFMVVEDEYRPGILTLREITKVPRHLWSRIKVREVMKPWEKLVSISSGTPVLAALREMEAAGEKLAPVVDGTQLKGVLSREQVMRYLRLRTELGT